MNSQEYVAIAVARWIAERLKNNNDFACEGLPLLDVPTLFRELAEDKEFQAVAAEFSIALAGQNATSVDMAEMARRAGLSNLQAFTDDLHLAAEWRNDRQHHPRSIVLAAGYNAGVHTLSHYARPSGTALPRAMLKDARDKLPARFPNSPEVHRTLLDTLETDPALESLLSLEACSAFLARWDALRREKENHAPWMSLPALGLLTDKDLFAQDSLGKRLKLNLEFTQLTRNLRASTIRTLANKKYRDAGKQRQIAEAVVAVEHYLTAIQQGQENGLDLSVAMLVVRPPKEQEAAISPGEPDSPDDENGGDSPSGGDPAPPFSKASSDALLDGREEDLTAIADAIEQAWQDRDENSDDDVEITVAFPGGGQEIKETVPVAKDVLGWVRDFCNETNWGGFFETPETSLRAALAGAADRSPTFLQPHAVVVIDGESLSLESILAAWDEDIPRLCPGVETQMAVTWREFSTLRNALLPHLGKLIYHPRHWLDGRPGILFQIRRYLELASTLYRETQEHYHVMESGSFDWARAALEALLALDTIQVRVLQPDGKTLAKAVLLPTHPLHLWRNERLSTLLRGLASSTGMGADERETVRQELERPEQFLSVVHLSSLPAGLGLKQLLPYTDQIEGLPVFENLSNACSGPDGAKILREALDKFIILHPNHPHPLRVALVNPPRGEDLIIELVRLLKDPRYRSGQKLSAIHIDIYASSLHRDRLHNALRFQDSRKEDEIQEQVAAGRLHLRVHDGVPGETSLTSVVEHLRKQPCHVAAIFDESTIRLRQKTMGRILPMSPFCIRHDVQVDHRSGRIELRPQPGESPFSEFMQLMKELDRSQRDAIIQVYADAEGLADTADALLQGEQPAARWLFLADRALPSEAGMKSVRIWERKEGLRDTFLATRDFGVISRLLRPVFSRCNITLTPEAMQLLLHQGSRLLGSGLLDIIKKNDGLPDQKKVIGLAGLLFAARDMQVRFPGAMVLSVDHPLARMWLRTGKRQSLSERCDLLVLWKDEKPGGYELIAVEVKTSDDEQLVNAPARASHADSQIRNTLEAVQDGLGAAGAGQTSPLSIPRCEMLKHTLVRAAQARSGDPEADRANRIRWGAWLTELFGQTTPNVTLSGCLVSVLLRRTAPSIEEKFDTPGPWTIVHRVLGEKDASDLLGQKTLSSDLPQETVSTPRAATENTLQPIEPNLTGPSETPDQVHPGLTSDDDVQVSSSGEKPPCINDAIRDRTVTPSLSDAKPDGGGSAPPFGKGQLWPDC
ncbi:MAG: hypothetical protein HQL63_14580 [Magnetococcales bacterium]|nr:hypothetical protein [Magnetococcales bacterium]